MGKRHCGRGAAVEVSPQNGANSEVGDASGAVSVEALAGNGVAVETTLAVGAGVSVGGCAVDGLQAAVKPANNKPVKRMFFKMFFMPTLLDNE